MNSTPNIKGKHWFVLNFVRPNPMSKPEKHIEIFNRNRAVDDSVELFAPTFKLSEVVDGKVVFKEKSLTFFYVFVRGTLEDLKELCCNSTHGFSFIIDRLSINRYGIVSDETMNSFKQIALLYSNVIPFYNIDDIDLEGGDIVEIIDGRYAGLRGTYMPRSRSNKGNLVIAATANLGTVIWDVEAKYVRILKFARECRRQYDLLDSFIPKLFPILRKYHEGVKLSQKETSLLSVFNQRMCVVAPDNGKLEAKLLATLMCVQCILGDMSGHARTCQRFKRRENEITNNWTRALVTLLQSVTNRNLSALKSAYDSICLDSEGHTARQKLLLTEYDHYLHQSAK